MAIWCLKSTCFSVLPVNFQTQFLSKSSTNQTSSNWSVLTKRVKLPNSTFVVTVTMFQRLNMYTRCLKKMQLHCVFINFWFLFDHKGWNIYEYLVLLFFIHPVELKSKVGFTILDDNSSFLNKANPNYILYVFPTIF